jgi:hypothetical protein
VLKVSGSLKVALFTAVFFKGSIKCLLLPAKKFNERYNSVVSNGLNAS